MGVAGCTLSPADVSLLQPMLNLLFHRCRSATFEFDGRASQAAPALDADALGRLHELDPDGSRGFVAQVLKTYETSMLRHLARLQEAMSAGDHKLAGEIAHTLKSSSASVGALGFSRHCLELEREAKKGEGAELVTLAGALQGEGQRVLVAVRAMLRA